MKGTSLPSQIIRAVLMHRINGLHDFNANVSSIYLVRTFIKLVCKTRHFIFKNKIKTSNKGFANFVSFILDSLALPISNPDLALKTSLSLFFIYPDEFSSIVRPQA
jgi:hypothetical protein